MTTQVSGTTGVSKVQDGVVVQADLAANVVGNGPAFIAQGTGTVTPNTTSTVQLFAETKDTDNAYNPATGRFTPQIAGYYQISAYLNFGASVAAGKSIFLAVNGVQTIWSSFSPSDVGSYETLNVSSLIYLNGTSDYIDCRAYVAGSGPVTPTGYFSGFLARAM